MYDKIRKVHKIKLSETNAIHKIHLERESFFFVDEIPENSNYRDLIEDQNEINFKQ